jgi:hypothetical protein
MRTVHRRSRVAILAAIATSIAVSMPYPVAAGDNEARGATITVRGDHASFLPTASRGGTLLLPDVSARSVFDHDRGDPAKTRLPTAGALKLLGDEDSVQALVRRLDAPEDEDAYAMTLSELAFDPTRGFSATVALDDSLDRRLGRADIDSGTPPAALGAVELVALDRNAPVRPNGAPKEPRRAAASDNLDNTVNVNVTSTFPDQTRITLTKTGGDCITNQKDYAYNQGNPPYRLDGLVTFEKVSSGGSCWIQPSTANWQVSIQPPGVDATMVLWAYFHVTQLSPVSWIGDCTTISQPSRPKCEGQLRAIGNNVDFSIAPG